MEKVKHLEASKAGKGCFRRTEVEPTEDMPCKVSVRFGYRKSLNYQSLEVVAEVSLPCAVGREKKTLTKALGIAVDFINENQDDLDKTLEAL